MLQLVFLCLFLTAIKAQVVEDVLCEGRVFEPKCQQGNIRIVAGSYGKTDGAFCGGNDPEPWSVNCAVDVAEQLRASCQGRPSCSVPVVGGDACVGTSKYLQIVWGCETGVPQNRVNNRNINIMSSNSADRTNPSALHGKVVSGANTYVFLDTTGNSLIEARWFVDQTNLVVTVDDTAPYELYPARAWDTSSLTDGPHRIMALFAFEDGSTGSIDATVTVRNGQAQAAPPRIQAAAAIQRASDSYTESATLTAVDPIVPKEVPWALFGVAALVAVILLAVIVVKSRSTQAN
jgi:hypothetical protein